MLGMDNDFIIQWDPDLDVVWRSWGSSFGKCVTQRNALNSTMIFCSLKSPFGKCAMQKNALNSKILPNLLFLNQSLSWWLFIKFNILQVRFYLENMAMK